MKLIIQIPCLNEEEILPTTLGELPRTLAGITKVEWLVIDDGSTDRTVEVARRNGADHVISIGHNKGLANAFMTGLAESLKLGADIVVNTDADNQYDARDIGKLVEPILEGRADYVIGARPISEMQHFSLLKKILQKLGSWTVRIFSGLDIQDAPSGFRAMSRETCYKLNVFNTFTYTLETLIQAGHSNIRTISVPIRVNGETRPSRLFKGIFGYVVRSLLTILRLFVLYRAFSFFMSLATIVFGVGLLIGARFMYLNFVLGEAGHVQSVILSGAFLTIGFMIGTTAVIADLINVNRRLIEQVRQILLHHKYDHYDSIDKRS